MRPLLLAIALALPCLACSDAPEPPGATAPVAAALAGEEDGAASQVGPTGEPPAEGAPDAAPEPPRLSPACLDGQVALSIPGRQPSVATVVAEYAPERARELLLHVLGRRWPEGFALVEAGVALAGPDVPDCLTQGLQGDAPPLARDLLDRLRSVVHACGHAVDAQAGAGGAPTYWLGPEQLWRCEALDAEGPAAPPPRSRILGDPFASERPPCPAVGPLGCDGFAAVYLDGDPGDERLDTGDLGMADVLEEVLQYQHSLMAARAVSDHLIARTSARDGLLTSLWYLTRYLRMMRLGYPQAYRAVLDSPCWRELLLTLWGRAWRLLDATADDRHLGLEDVALEDLVTRPALLREIARVRRAHGCE